MAAEYKKLPVEDRCVHQLWHVRKDGYEEAAKTFRQIDKDKSPVFGKFMRLLEKFVVDSHPVCQEKGVEATLAFVENCVHGGKTVREVMSGIITKCVAAPKLQTRELAVQVILAYIAIGKGKAVQEELMKGMEQKNPKIVAGCISACTICLKQFGHKMFSLKPLVKKISALCSDRDKNVRDEARIMLVEIYRWIGGALRSELATLQPVKMAELEAEFSKVGPQRAVPQRYIKPEQKKRAGVVVEVEEVDGAAAPKSPSNAPPLSPTVAHFVENIINEIKKKHEMCLAAAEGRMEKILKRIPAPCRGLASLDMEKTIVLDDQPMSSLPEDAPSLTMSPKNLHPNDGPILLRRSPRLNPHHATVGEICRDIHAHREDKGGFKLLANFLREHPEVDMDVFLGKSSAAFKDFIKKGVEELG